MLMRYTLIYGVGRGIPGLVNFMTIAIYTRMLQPDDYGYYALMIASVGLWNTVLFEWLRLGLLRFYPGHSELPHALLATLACGFAAIAVLAATGTAIAVLLVPDGEFVYMLILGLALLCAQAWFELNLELVRSQLSPVRYAQITAWRAVVALACGVVLIHAGLGAGGALLGMLVALVVSVIPFARESWRGIRPSMADRRLLRELLVFGLPLTASLALNFIISSSDRFLLTWLVDAEATGIYAAGYDTVWHSMTLLMMTVNLAGYPIAVRALERDGVMAAREQVRQNFTLLAAIAAPTAVGIAVGADAIGSVVLGAAYRETAVGLLPWVALGALIARFRSYYVDLAFHLGRKTGGQVWVMTIAAMVNVLLNLWWIPKFGVYGAIYATIVAYAVAFLAGLHVGRRAFPLPAPPLEAIKPVVAAAVMAAALWPSHGNLGPAALAWQLGLGAAVYASALLALDFAGCGRRLARLVATHAVNVVGR